MKLEKKSKIEWIDKEYQILSRIIGRSIGLKNKCKNDKLKYKKHEEEQELIEKIRRGEFDET